MSTLTLYRFTSEPHSFAPEPDFNLVEVTFLVKGTQLWVEGNEPHASYLHVNRRFTLEQLERRGWRKTPKEAVEAELNLLADRVATAQELVEAAHRDLERAQAAVTKAGGAQ